MHAPAIGDDGKARRGPIGGCRRQNGTGHAQRQEVIRGRFHSFGTIGTGDLGPIKAFVFQYDDEEDSVTITAADGQFDGSIVVTGQGVDADTTGEDEQTIIDRVADSIIFG